MIQPGFEHVLHTLKMNMLPPDLADGKPTLTKESEKMEREEGRSRKTTE